jgi:xylulokinase
MIAGGVLRPGGVLDSVGTAESMLGVLPGLVLDDRAYRSGLAIVPHVLPGRYCWLGGLSAAGGSVEWLRAQLGDPPLAYDELLTLAHRAPAEPTGILYFPYLSGSGAPLPDGAVRAAFAGLDARHGRSDLVKAVLEGTAYAAEGIRRVAGELSGQVIGKLIAVGGATRSDIWMQLKADVSGCPITVPDLDEATVTGAALTAAFGLDMIAEETLSELAQRRIDNGTTYLPDERRHAIYARLYQDVFMTLQQPLRKISAALSNTGRDV